MNVVSRGIKNATRSPLRGGAIVLMLAISIGLVLSMMVARSSVQTKINDVLASAGTKVTINAAGINGFAGGGNPLTADNVTTIKNTAHVASISSTLTDQLGSTDTNLQSSLELGSFGERQNRFSDGSVPTPPADSTSNGSSTTTDRQTMRSRINVTGTTNPNVASVNGGTLVIGSGKTIDGNSSDLVALIGQNLATKNNLSAGSTFTAYGKTITVNGIYSTDNSFTDNGIIMPLATVQNLTGQPGAVTSVVATIDSSENVDSTVSALKSKLGSSVDVTSEAAQAENSVSALKGIASLSLAGVIGAAIAATAIILLAMILIVRERRREIGVLKAIGGSNFKVIGQFVVESLTITIIGAVVGLALGVLVSGPMTTALASSSSNSSTVIISNGSGSTATVARPAGDFGGFGRGLNQLRTNITNVTASLTPQIFLSAMGITLAVAIIGSLLPAWLIARIRPAEVLRTE